jgi:TonB family protein
MFIPLLFATAIASVQPVVLTVTCIKTTIEANGRTTDSSVAESSGSTSADRHALKMVRMLNVRREPSQRYQAQTGFVLVETHPTGAFGMSALDLGGKLLPTCARPSIPGGT